MEFLIRLRSLVLLTSSFYALSAHAVGLKILSPVPGAPVLSDQIELEVKGCKNPSFWIFVGEEPIPAKWRPGSSSRHWLTTLDLNDIGTGPTRTFSVSMYCGQIEWTRTLTVRRDLDAQAITGRALHHALKTSKRLKWDRNTALYFEGLRRIAERCPTFETEVLTKAIRFYREQDKKFFPRRIDRTELAAPSLALGWILEKYPSLKFKRFAQSLEYFATEKRNDLGMFTTMGTRSPLSGILPHVSTVEALFDYVYPALKIGQWHDKPALVEFARKQASLFVENLQKPDRSSFFVHALHTRRTTKPPKGSDELPEKGVPLFKGTRWLRGNALAALALTEILAATPIDHPLYPILHKGFRTLGYALALHQMPDGLWDTLVDRPGQSYAETSGSAIAAYALARGAKMGILPPEFRDYALKAFEGLATRLSSHSSTRMFLTGVSGVTLPTLDSLYPLIIRHEDRPEGNGAFLILASEVIDSCSF